MEYLEDEDEGLDSSALQRLGVEEDIPEVDWSLSTTNGSMLTGSISDGGINTLRYIDERSELRDQLESMTERMAVLEEQMRKDRMFSHEQRMILEEKIWKLEEKIDGQDVS